MTINFQKKLTKMIIVRKILTKKEKDKNQKNKNLVVSLLELILMKKCYDVFKAINGIFKPTNNYLIN